MSHVLFNAYAFESGVDFITSRFETYITDFSHPDDDEVRYFVGVHNGHIEVLKLVSQFGPNTVVLVTADPL